MQKRHGSVFCKMLLYLASVSFDPYDDIHRLLLKNLYLDVRKQLEGHKVIYSDDHYFVELRHGPHSVLYFERRKYQSYHQIGLLFKSTCYSYERTEIEWATNRTI
jgi:hypothetical protein